MAGKNSVVYVETEPGRFEIRRVVLGHQSGDRIAIHDGINPGEKVAIKGNFLIDSQMQLAGNPSLINPEKYVAPEAEELSPEMLAALEKLPPKDKTLATAQQICPVTEMALGSMGTPPKAEVNGRTVFLCCEGCRGSLMKEPEKYLAVLDNKDSGTQSESAPDLPPIGRPMIQSLLQFCLKERLLVLLTAVSLAAFGWYCTYKVPLDAIPNVGENQVIVLTEWAGRSPKDIEDQITYPLSIGLQAVPGSKSVRGKSMFGFSFVQVTFADGVDFYWARSRVAEQLTALGNQLPEGVTPSLGPDATALGQIYYYVLEGPPEMDLAELRSKQDFFLKYALQSVDGVAEVASIGGYLKQYQVEVDPDQLRFHDIPLSLVIDAVKASNIDVGAKTVETSGMEFIVRGRGFIGAGKTEPETIEQIENTVIQTRDGIPVRVRDLAQVQVGPSFRRGAIDLNGRETVGGVVVMRYGENPREVIQRIKSKIASLESELGGIKILGIYDRTQLIDETVATLTDALSHEILITIAVVVLFLLNVRSSLIIAITLPMAVLMSFAAMKWFHVDANIMSLAGIAIAIGTMVDMGIIVLENIYDALAEWEAKGAPGGPRQRLRVIQESASEVIPAVLTAVSTTIVSFLPVFFLTGRDYKLFAPLAWTKTFALAASLIVAVTVVP
ncbi:cusA, partial [Symbiodinium microadriaticum]